MGVKTYSIKKYGKDYKLSEHFTLKEFRCKDGTDKVLVSTELIQMLEKLRAYGGFTITIISGYRTPAYNKAIGGASKSTHCDGYAADALVMKDGIVVNPKLICCLAQTLGFRGIGRMSTDVHLDMANRIYRGDELKNYSNNVGGDFYKYFGISKAEVEKLKVKEQVTEPQKDKPATDEEDDDMIYKIDKDLTNIPDWGKDAIRLRRDILGTFAGDTVTESMLRCWVIEDRESPFIKDVNDVPATVKAEVQVLIDAGKIKGDGKYQIGLRWQDLRIAIICNRK